MTFCLFSGSSEIPAWIQASAAVLTLFATALNLWTIFKQQKRQEESFQISITPSIIPEDGFIAPTGIKMLPNLNFDAKNRGIGAAFAIRVTLRNNDELCYVASIPVNGEKHIVIPIKGELVDPMHMNIVFKDVQGRPHSTNWEVSLGYGESYQRLYLNKRVGVCITETDG